MGNALMKKHPKGWKRKLPLLAKLDWSRNNPFWEGRALIGGRVSKSAQNVTLTTNAIKTQLGIALSAEETRLEDAYKRGDRATLKA